MDRRPLVIVCGEGLTSLRLQKALSALGYRAVYGSASDPDLTRHVLALAPDALLIDFQLLDQPACKRLERLREARPSMLILAIVSTTSQKEAAERVRASGILEKPFTDDQFRSQLERRSREPVP